MSDDMVEGGIANGSLRWLDLKAADKPLEGSIFAYGDDGFHVTPEAAAILARSFGSEFQSHSAAVNGTDADKLIYGAVMLLREELRHSIDGLGLLLDPLRRVLFLKQCKRMRTLKHRLRQQLHNREKLHGPCPAKLRAWMWKESVEYYEKHLVYLQEMQASGERLWRDTRSYWIRKAKLISPHKKHRLRKLYDEWMKTRARKRAATEPH